MAGIMEIKAYDDIESFAEGSNDPVAEDIEIELGEAGLSLVYPGEVSDDGTTIFFDMTKE